MRVELIYAPGGVLPPVEEVFSRATGLNHNERRRAIRIELRKRKQMEIGEPVTVDMVPPGSLLSEETLARIRNGEFRLARIRDENKPHRVASRRLAR